MAKKVKVELVFHTMQTETTGRIYTQRGWETELAGSGSEPGPLEKEMRETVSLAFPESHKAFIADMLSSDQASKVELAGYTLTITPINAPV